ncbi:MAG: class I adenylate-forming enzyme family protein [bacterium]|nr:class I adenylate-forming enzyme family protein [bacterium]
MEEIKNVEKILVDNIIDRNQNHFNITALEYFGTKITYKEFFKLIELYAKSFQNLGIKNGDVVTLCLAGTPDAVITFYALNKLGAVANFVNPNYFKINSKKYMDGTGSTVLFILDRFYDKLKDSISETKTNKIILSSLSSYASVFNKFKLDKNFFKTINKNKIIKGIEYFDLDSFLVCGKNNNNILKSVPYEKNKDVGIFYTSGTTGDPKGVLVTNDGFNNMITMYDVLNGMDRVAGDRNLVVIPPMYETGISHGINAPFAFGCTNILQPIYDKYTFANDLKKYKPNTVTAAGSHYATAIESNLKRGDLESLRYPCTGGEALTKEFAREISEKLMYFGAKNPLIIGYGASEFGCMVMINQYLKNRTNESGYTMPFVEARIVDTITGKELGANERGEVQVRTPAMMKSYYKMPEKTLEIFCVDENGKKWAKTGDYGLKNENGVYEVFGRITDSFINEKGESVYLFEYEQLIARHPAVLECEAVAITIDNKKVPVIHLVLKKDYKNKSEEVLREIYNLLLKEKSEYMPYCFKIRDGFNTSPISGKRDYLSLLYETNGFINIDNKGQIININIDTNESKQLDGIAKSKKLKLNL